MPLIDAERFIKEITVNNELRKSLYRFDSSADVQDGIKECGYNFKLFEFEETINHLKTESPDEEQAIMLDEILLWWNMLMGDGSIVESDQPECSPSKCPSCSLCR
ncbi:MAG: hypothetical protein PQJ61_14615 [Spirochaetales bacterium]|uniref:Nif11 domain-containing protein n=1 Tax=Candidatus Thalassospirochaeta sargassi TaxID=3119039 RepID=A0AAJ1IHF6_9SPIO|nr:hypothetical protein [Spirochaetales bacterium]